jgi:stress-induced morphogen
VASDRFKSLSRIKQHQLVNKVLEDEVKTWHGMQVSGTGRLSLLH